MMVYPFLMKILVMSHFNEMKFISCNEMRILSVNLNNINLDNNFDDDNPDNIILIRNLAWYGKFKKRKALKKR